MFILQSLVAADSRIALGDNSTQHNPNMVSYHQIKFKVMIPCKEKNPPMFSNKNKKVIKWLLLMKRVLTYKKHQNELIIYIKKNLGI